MSATGRLGEHPSSCSFSGARNVWVVHGHTGDDAPRRTSTATQRHRQQRCAANREFKCLPLWPLELTAREADGWRPLAHGTSPEAVERVELHLVSTFKALVALRGETGDHGLPVAVDVPMGLPQTGRRRPCDAQARALLGARGNAVFAPPSRPLLAAPSYEAARQLTSAAKLKDAAAQGLSAQAFGLAPKMREADAYLRAHPDAQAWLWECHPELSFRALAAGRVLRDKKSVGGQAERLRLLCDRFPDVLDALEAFAPGGRAADTADALDALVALDTALHVLDDDYEELGGEKDATGLIMRMVF